MVLHASLTIALSVVMEDNGDEVTSVFRKP
jgi:hypothetical protein